MPLEQVGKSFGFFPLCLPLPDFVPSFSRAVGEPFPEGLLPMGALPKAPKRLEDPNSIPNVRLYLTCRFQRAFPAPAMGSGGL